MRNVSDTGLSILYQMLQNMASNDAAAQSFYQTYYTDVLQHIFSVVTDSSHTAGQYAIAALLAASAYFVCGMCNVLSLQCSDTVGWTTGTACRHNKVSLH